MLLQLTGDEKHGTVATDETVSWLCGAAGETTMCQPEVAAAMLAPDMVLTHVEEDGQAVRRWIWEVHTACLLEDGRHHGWVCNTQCKRRGSCSCWNVLVWLADSMLE